MKLGLKAARTRHRYRTIEVAPAGSVSADARVLQVDLRPEPKLDPLLYYVIATTVLVFLFDSLDLVTKSPVVAKLIIDSINWGSLYLPFFPDRIWAPVTSMFYHSTWEHIIGNMVGFYIVALWLARAYSARAWQLFFFVGGPLAGIAFVYIYKCPPADFSHWHGPLAALTGEPNTPLAGASGGVFAMIGAALAAASRYRLARVQSWMQIGLLQLILLPLMQFLCVDLGNAGIAGMAHQLALAIGFVFGWLPRLNGPVTVITSNPEAISIDSVTVDDLNKQAIGVIYRVSPQFDNDRDFLVKKQDYLGGKGVPSYKLLGGKRPPAEAEGQVVPLHVMPVKLTDEFYRKFVRAVVPRSAVMLLAVSALSQVLMNKYSSPLYPSIFVGTFIIGALALGAAIYSSRTILAWQKPGDGKDAAELPAKVGLSAGVWESQ